MFLDTANKTECFGCEACEQICPKQAIEMQEDEEGFRYPFVRKTDCIDCNLCRIACPYAMMPEKHRENKYAFGGYIKDAEKRFESTSGGAFSAVVEAFCDHDYAIFGAEAKRLQVFHSYITNKHELYKYRKSKYDQSVIGGSYKKVHQFLLKGKKVLFSGTPCQIAGLYAYLTAVKHHSTENLLTVEVVCEGVPSPWYIRKMDDDMEARHGSRIESLDYRYTGISFLGCICRALNAKKYGPIPRKVFGKWDFQIMRVQLLNKQLLKKDRWFNPFWSIWLNHLMSRPSCYDCPFAEQGRTADITLGDLWGVHLYCPELYGHNGGASLAVGNTEKGRHVLKLSEQYMYGHELIFEDALKYQSPMRSHISGNSQRKAFMDDLKSNMTFEEINRKWAKKPTLKLLWQKYVWGNRQKIALWNLKHRFTNGDKQDA